IDCGTESLPRITDKAKTYLDYWQSGREQETDGVYPRVLWVAPDEARLCQLVEALSRFEPEHWRLFATTTSDRAADYIAGGSAS
ncbi:MAG: replication-relaxation family protein, partial [Dehalococcoidia bacterium]